MKITTWNVNSLKVRLPHVLEYLENEKPDVLALQETKQQDKDFPQEAIEAAGYHVQFAGQKTYNGVAMISRKEASDVVFDVPNLDDPQRRLLAATIDGVRIVDVYIHFLVFIICGLSDFFLSISVCLTCSSLF